MRLLFFHCVTISPINFLDLSCLSKILELENTVMYIILSTFSYKSTRASIIHANSYLSNRQHEVHRKGLDGSRC